MVESISLEIDQKTKLERVGDQLHQSRNQLSQESKYFIKDNLRHGLHASI